MRSGFPTSYLYHRTLVSYCKAFLGVACTEKSGAAGARRENRGSSRVRVDYVEN